MTLRHVGRLLSARARLQHLPCRAHRHRGGRASRSCVAHADECRRAERARSTRRASRTRARSAARRRATRGVIRVEWHASWMWESKMLPTMGLPPGVQVADAGETIREALDEFEA